MRSAGSTGSVPMWMPMTMPVSAKAAHMGSHSSSFQSGRPNGGRTGTNPTWNPAPLARLISATASLTSTKGIDAAHTNRGEWLWKSRAKSFWALHPSRATFGVRMLKVQMPSEG